MKECAKCLCNKNFNEFAYKNMEKKTLSPVCRACHKIYRDNHYKANKQKAVDRVALRKLDIKLWFKDLKNGLSCTKCDFKNPAALQFHHNDPTEKSINYFGGGS